jgi:hypothetical protein
MVSRTAKVRSGGSDAIMLPGTCTAILSRCYQTRADARSLVLGLAQPFPGVQVMLPVVGSTSIQVWPGLNVKG